MMDYTVIIPAYNEERNLPSLLKSLRKISKMVIVVDDGSTDRTYEVARKFGATVIKHERNFGKGRAIISALNKCKTDFVVLIDADGQHLPSEIPLLLKKLGRCDLVVGNRFAKKQYVPFHRRIANKLLSVLLKRTGVSDPLCGFRAFRRKSLPKLEEEGFNIELEILFKAVDKRLAICEVPITVKYYKLRKSKTEGLLQGALLYMRLLVYALSWLLSNASI